MKNNIIRRVFTVLFTLIIQMAILFGIAGTFAWPEAWYLCIASFLILLVNLFWIPAELIAKRGAKQENVKNWDRILTRVSIIPFLGIFILAGLDFRFGWSGSISQSVEIIAVLVYFASSMFFTWSMVSNKFFTTGVTVTPQQGHTVETGGPYRFIRHPGYIAFILTYISIPLILGSLYALSMSGLIALLFILRTYLEDETLKKELPGYAEYAGKVKFRLIPYIW